MSIIRAYVSHLWAMPAVRVAAVLIVCLIVGSLAPVALLAAPFAVGAVLTETIHDGGFLVSEANGRRSRSEVTVTVPAATKLVAGYVLGKLSADGKYVPYDNANTDGSEAAAAILYTECDNSDGGAPTDFTATVIDMDAEVREDDLTWLDAQNDKTAGLADLLALGIKAR